MNARLDIKASIPPREFYRAELPDAPKWKPGATGWQDGGLCPFHTDEHAGSFRVNLGTGGFICFACDARGSSVLDFTMQRHGLNFISAVRKLRRDWGA